MTGSVASTAAATRGLSFALSPSYRLLIDPCVLEPGAVVIHSVPGLRHCNPIGSVHGGSATILSGSAMGSRCRAPRRTAHETLERSLPAWPARCGASRDVAEIAPFVYLVLLGHGYNVDPHAAGAWRLALSDLQRAACL